MSSLDKVNGLLTPVQPDLSWVKPQNKRMYSDKDSYTDMIKHE